MSVTDLMANRYSERRFSPAPVEDEKLQAILAAGALAPTAENKQPQRILVVRGDEALAKMDKCTRCRFGAPVVLVLAYDMTVAARHPDVTDFGTVDIAIVGDHMSLAAEELGVRMFASRGSMDLSRKDGGLPPDSVVQTVDEIMADSVRCIEKYHDDSYGAMCRVALAPCSPFSVSAELLRQSAILARQYHVRLHTHLCETKDEENFMLQREGIRPLEYMARLGWLGDDVWFAHGIHFNDEELRLLARTGTGVAHCPISNMKLASGVARIPEMLALGVPVGLAVDGSASNDGSSLLEELRVAFLLHRLHASRQAPTGYDILKMATRGSARLLGRDDIGQLSVGKCADLFMIDSRRLELVGCDQDAGSVLGTVGVRGPVDYTVVQGRVTVRQGHLVTVDEELVAREANNKCRDYLANV